jgi:hypothetical protein
MISDSASPFDLLDPGNVGPRYQVEIAPIICTKTKKQTLDEDLLKVSHLRAIGLMICCLGQRSLIRTCLQMIPGYHNGNLLDHVQDGYYVGKIVEPIDESQAVPVEGKAGTAIFMHCMTPHASVTNRSRRTLILSYRAADSFPIYSGDVTGELEKPHGWHEARLPSVHDSLFNSSPSHAASNMPPPFMSYNKLRANKQPKLPWPGPHGHTLSRKACKG